MSGATRKQAWATRRWCSSSLAFVVAVDREQRLAARRAHRPDREQALHARRRHASGARRHRRADQPLSLLLERGDGDAADAARLRDRVREMLEEFAANAPDGKLVLHVVDPLPFSEEEDRAEQFGLQARGRRPRAARPSTSASPARTASARRTRIPFFQPDPRKEAFLEYDLARLVYNLAHPRQDRRRPAVERADRRRLRSADAAADAAVGRRRAGAPALRGADAAGERARDRRRRRRALDRASRDARRTRRSTPSTSSCCAAAAR